MEILLPIAQDFMDEQEAEKLLEQPDFKKEKEDVYLLYKLRGALIFNHELDSAVLSQMYQVSKCRKYLLLYYLSHKKFNDALSITTPPGEFPDLEKVFLTWYNGNQTFLPRLAQKLMLKNQGDSITVTLLCRFWMGDITQEQLRANLRIIPTKDLGLVYTVLAENARRNNRQKTAEVLYEKASKLARGIYNTMLQNYR